MPIIKNFLSSLTKFHKNPELFCQYVSTILYIIYEEKGKKGKKKKEKILKKKGKAKRNKIKIKKKN